MSAKFVIPQDFFKALTKHHPGYSLMWVEWLSYGSLIFNPKFVDNLNYKNWDKAKVRECYDIGMRFLDDGLIFDEQEIAAMKDKASQPPDNPKKEENMALANEIIQYLNKQTESNYKAKTGATYRLINGRIKEGYTIDDFKKVIDIKTAEWKNTEMAKYLRPATLFHASKFENYLHQAKNPKNASSQSVIQGFQNVVDEAKRRALS